MTKYSELRERLTVLSFCKQVLRPFRWLIMAMFIICAIWAANVSIRPYLIKIILNKVSSFTQEDKAWYLLLPILTYLSMSLLMEITCRLYDFLSLKIFPELKKSITNKLMIATIEHDYAFYQNNFTGSLVSKINNVVDAVPTMVEIFLSSFFVQALSIVIAAYTLWQVAPKFSFIVSGWSTIFIFVSIMAGKRASIISDQVSDVRSVITGKMADVITNITSMKLFTARNYENNLLNYSLTESVETEIKLKWLFFKTWAFQGAAFFILELLCLYLLIHDRRLGLVTPGDFALILTLNISITELLWRVFKDFTNFSKLFGQTTQGLRTIMEATGISDMHEADRLIVHRGSIVFKNVCFNYPGAEPLFSEESLIIDAGQKIGLVGYSGSGKTTFVNLILRLFELQSGCITIDGQNIASIVRDSLWESIAVIPQDPSLFHRSLLENIRYGRLQASDEEVVEAAKKAFAHEFIMTFKQQYNTLVGERGVKLSSGQRQRIAIARAILKDAPILILDEATSSLDSVTEVQIQESLRELMQRKTAIIVAHRLSTLLHMNRIIVFDQGRIVEDGKHYELIKKGGFYKALWDAQIGGFLPEDKKNTLNY